MTVMDETRQQPSEHPESCARYVREAAEESASLYVLRSLSDEETVEFERHLKSGCTFCEGEVSKNMEVIGELARSETPLIAPIGLRERLLERVREEKEEAQKEPADESLIQQGAGPATRAVAGVYVVRGGQGDWRETGCPGVRYKTLSVDEERRYATMLVQMDAGASYPSHHHAGVEECYVLEGDVQLGDTVLRPGDFQYAAEGSDHIVQSTREGCLLLVVASQDDEVH